ncbi:MAG: alpha-glucosidase, partial [Ilumatobacteraceae bacterium]|nr:alpha-glucosidase [Ilumatobacteraceae bacterium]
ANNGARLRTTFELTRAGLQVALHAVVDGNGYPDFVRQQFELVIHGAVASTIVVDGTQRPLDGGRLTLPNDGNAFTIEFAAG